MEFLFTFAVVPNVMDCVLTFDIYVLCETGELVLHEFFHGTRWTGINEKAREELVLVKQW